MRPFKKSLPDGFAACCKLSIATWSWTEVIPGGVIRDIEGCNSQTVDNELSKFSCWSEIIACVLPRVSSPEANHMHD